MTDRELLELAAKAAGISFKIHHEVLNQWNPLNDDGDALRLAVKLQTHGCEMRLGKFNNLVGVGFGVNWFEESLNDDPYAATRRAIVRAAAEIGKEKNT